MCIVDSHRHLIALFKISSVKKLRLPDSAPWSLKWDGIIHVNQRARLPNEVKAKRETCKSAEKRECTIATSYMETLEENQINSYTHPEMECQCMSNVLLKGYSGG